MNRRIIILVLVLLVVAAAIAVPMALRRNPQATPLRVAIAPYQDLAMLVNAAPLGAEQKHGVKLELVTMPWENILPAVSSAGPTVDVGFGSLVEYLTKYDKLNAGAADPVLFVQPLYVYKGGGFIALDPKVPILDAVAMRSQDSVKSFMTLRLGAQRQSLYEMVLFSVARRQRIDPRTLRVIDISMDDGLLALQSGSLDATSAGLTQLSEARKRGGRLVLSMDDAGFADVVGFICKKSTLDHRRPELEGLVRAWFESVDYVLADLPNNSSRSLEYLRAQAATKYTFEEYESALGQEFLPRTLAELHSGILSTTARFPFERICSDINAYLLENKIVQQPAPVPTPLLTGR